METSIKSTLGMAYTLEFQNFLHYCFLISKMEMMMILSCWRNKGNSAYKAYSTVLALTKAQ